MVWDWEPCREALVGAAAAIMQLDLKALMRGLPGAERLVNVCTEMVSCGCYGVAAALVGEGPGTGNAVFTAACDVSAVRDLLLCYP